MISLRDPVRDNLLFVDFAQGAAAGVRAAGRAQLARLRAAHRQAELRSAARELRAFGAAGALRHRPGHQRRQSESVRLPAGRNHPRCCWCFSWPATSPRAGTCCATRAKRGRAAGRATTCRRWSTRCPCWSRVALSLVFFFLQKDMGPALVFACLFLVLYGIARGSAFVPLAGLALLAAGFALRLSASACRTRCGERVSMWLSPWDNVVHGGDQLAHSLWAYATGGVAGTGIGLGDARPGAGRAYRPDSLRARRRDGASSGVALVFALYAFLVWRSLRIALRARTDYEFFLAAGLDRGHRAADPADRGRLARRPAALRRGHAVPELRPHRDAGELRGVRDPARASPRAAGRRRHRAVRASRERRRG